jgi:hypothetical protein
LTFRPARFTARLAFVTSLTFLDFLAGRFVAIATP